MDTISRYLQLAKERPSAFQQSEKLEILLDEEKIRCFSREMGKPMGVVYESPFHLMVVDLVQAPNGKPFAYERLMPAVECGAVVAIPILSGRFVLLEQYRHALRRMQYAFPRGFAEPNTTPDENVLKELKEELNAEVLSCRLIGTVVADSGVSGNEVSVYLCELTRADLKYQYEEIERMHLLSEEEMQQWIADGRIDDGFTLSAYTLMKHHRL